MSSVRRIAAARALMLVVLAVALATTASLASASSRVGGGRIFFIDEVGPMFVNSDGSGLHQALVGRGQHLRYLINSYSFAFAPDGHRLAYQCTLRPRRESKLGICVENIDGSGLRQLTHAPRNSYAGDSQPAWSRDGRRIVFVRSIATGRVERPEETYIYTINADGTALHKLPEPYTCAHDKYHTSHDPNLGPQGQLIYVCETNLVNGGMMIATDPEKPAVDTGCLGRRPQFSVDGARVLDTLNPPETFATSSRWASDPTDQADQCQWQQIGGDSIVEDAAVWSPDSTQIAYVGNNNQDVFVIRTDGTDQRRIFHGTRPHEIAAGSPIAWLPR